ncbi:MAG: AMP-binding protein [Bacteroidales bacterium]|nr:AMP-binding protein [Bacteroidales bacterium]
MTYSTLKDIFDHSVRTYSDRPAFSMINGISLTYGQFAEAVENTASMLASSGIRKGDKVAIFSGSTPWWPVAYFACVNYGITAVPILPDFNGGEAETLMEHCEAKALFASARHISNISTEFLSKLNIVMDTADLSVVGRSVDNGPSALDSRPEPDDLAVIIYTSGTTSEPKGVMLTHHALAMQINIYPSFYEINEEDVFLSILPLSHTYECSIGMLYPFSAGSSVVYLDRLPSASALMPAFAKVRPTVMIAVPLVIEKIYRSQVLGRIAKSAFGRFIYRIAPLRRIYHRLAGNVLMKVFGGRMRFLAIGGAKLNSAADRFMNESGLPYAVGYGLTETAPLLFAFKPGDGKKGAAGKAIERIEYRLADVNPETGAGELEVRTPSIMKGYYRNEEATRAAFTPDGWFRTKDICTIDRKGYMKVVGRSGNMIVGASGENIYPEEIENVLNTHFLVSESLVMLDKDNLIALVVYDNEKLKKVLDGMGDAADKMKKIHNDLIGYVNARFGKHSHIRIVEDQKEPFIKTPTQKIKRNLYQRQRRA